VLAYGKLRGTKLVLADVLNDENLRDEVLDEIGNCADCFRVMVTFMTSFLGSVCLGYTELAGGDRAAAIRQLDRQLMEAEAELRRV